MLLVAQPLTSEAFAPFGDVINRLTQPGRVYSETALGNGRPEAWPSLSMTLRAPSNAESIEVVELERHPQSSQSFIPVDAGRWLIIVAPHAPSGGPDTSQARAFVADGSQGVTYRINTWHHGLTVLDRPAQFAVFMWRDGTVGDEEFVPVSPFSVHIPS